eukprot:4799644-Prymnesium_polylepis.1
MRRAMLQARSMRDKLRKLDAQSTVPTFFLQRDAIYSAPPGSRPRAPHGGPGSSCPSSVLSSRPATVSDPTAPAGMPDGGMARGGGWAVSYTHLRAHETLMNL